MPVAGSIGTAYNIAPLMHNQYSACLDDNNNNNSLYLSLRPQNIDHICDDNIENDNNVSGKDDGVSLNDDSTAYALRFCVAISSFDGMLL